MQEGNGRGALRENECLHCMRGSVYCICVSTKGLLASLGYDLVRRIPVALAVAVVVGKMAPCFSIHSTGILLTDHFTECDGH